MAAPIIVALTGCTPGFGRAPSILIVYRKQSSSCTRGLPGKPYRTKKISKSF
jgi:hypothetical protein